MNPPTIPTSTAARPRMPAAATQGHRRRTRPGPRRVAAPHRPTLHPTPQAHRDRRSPSSWSRRSISMASPFLLRAVIDTALPQQDLPSARLAGDRHGRRRRRHGRPRRRPDLDQHPSRPAGHAHAAYVGLQPPAAPVPRLLHPHPHRRGAVSDHQRHRRHAVGRHVDRNLDRLQPDDRGRHRGRDVRPVVAAVPDLPDRDAAGDPAHPPGRPHAQGDHRRAPARAGRPQRHDRRGPVDQRRPAGQDDGCGTDPDRALRLARRRD